MLTLKSLLPKSFVRAGFKRQFDAYQILQVFQDTAKEVISEDLQKEIFPVSYKNGVIKLHFSHPVFAMEFRASEEKILSFLNKKLGKNIVQKFWIEN